MSDTTKTMKRRRTMMIGKRNGNRVASSEALKSCMAVGDLVCDEVKTLCDVNPIFRVYHLMSPVSVNSNS